MGIRPLKIYFAGDTGLMVDMALLAEEEIDVALLPIGDVYTMGPQDAQGYPSSLWVRRPSASTLRVPGCLLSQLWGATWHGGKDCLQLWA